METVIAQNAPQAVGPYCHGIKHGDLLFTSGQLALDPSTGAMVNDTIEAETEQVLKNLEAILKGAGTSKDKVIKVNVYITDLGDFARINEVYGSFFAPHTPARACVEVANLALGAKVEMDMVAAL
ncbi:Rid family detoxifying hydrolase [Desulforhopalus singaporensis]|uniref:2-iminobutanoate/2-iminopropanoate deaminase n=1 Tax=Desulforhopalus singaporensis TaxID=91360 RepID=A0A1H0N7V4_9BACT|nr:Rid family detoxifying hydrolase [Desulforhopalus singaporensis]SDO88799.1 2-iminobutanoate/2-iminopropanoate deaminase [Desulforhopalus singaporensis]